MELLYTWISKSDNNIMQDQEINFSTEYQFSYNKTTNSLLLNEQVVNNKSVFNEMYPNIENLSVLVGVNGSGKSTILQTIMDNFGFRLKDSLNQPNDIIYIFFYRKQFYVVTNIVGINIAFKSKICSDYDQAFKSIYSNLTKIYFTNASMGNLFSDMYHVDNSGFLSLSLTPKELDNNKRIFYQSLFPELSDNMIGNSNEEKWKRWLRDFLIQSSQFENILDILCYSPSPNKKRDDFVIPNYKFELDIINPFHVLYSRYHNTDYDTTDDPFYKKEFNYWLSRQTASNQERLTKLFEYEIIDADKEGKDFRLLCQDIEGLKGKSTLAKIRFLYDLFSRKSKVLKYINITTSPISSGERAFQNIFSWINSMSKLEMIFWNKKYRVKNNILLVLDEIDLYMHPQWQKNYISMLLKILNEKFKSGKVQVILATHSPICLSDVPSDNIIYLENNQIIQRNHINTFGRDTYTILNDSFFLKESMGNFAKDYINKLIQDIKDLDNSLSNNNKLNEIKRKIDLIGNDIVRNALNNQLLEKVGNSTEVQLIQQQIDLLKKRMEELRNHDSNKD